MDRIFLNEITRIHEIMGIKKPLLMESPNPLVTRLERELSGLLLKFNSKQITLFQLEGKIDDMIEDIDKSALKFNEKAALKKILNDAKINRSKKIGNNEYVTAEDFINDIKIRLNNNDVIKNSFRKNTSDYDVIVKEIIDLDAIKKTDDYINGLFDRSETINLVKQNAKDELLYNAKNYESIEDFIETNSENYARSIEKVLGYDYEASKKYFKNWLGKNIDFGNSFNKSGVPSNKTMMDSDNTDIPYRSGSSYKNETLDEFEPEVYLKYEEIIKKDRSEWTNEDLLLFQEVSKYENTMMDVDFSRFRNIDTNIDINVKDIPPSRFQVGGTSLENLRTPGHTTFGDSSSKYLLDSMGIPGYYAFITKDIGDEKVFYFVRRDIQDGAGRGGNFEVGIPFPKNSNVTLDDVKQILVDKSNEIHKNWLIQSQKPMGKVTSDLGSTPTKSKPLGYLNVNTPTSEIPVIIR